MVSSTTRKIFSLAISLLVVVISLTDVALGAVAPTGLSTLARYTPGFTGAPGKMARDAAGNFYVTDFWGKGIMKLGRSGNKIGFISTKGRPSAVAVLPDNRLVVAMAAPQPYIAFYSQTTGEELSQFGTPAEPLYRPTSIAVDAHIGVGGKFDPYIYVLDAGDSSGASTACGGSADTAATPYNGKIRVYSSTGAYLYVFGSRTLASCTSVTAGQFKQPAGIAYEKVSKNIVVADTLNSRLQFFKNYSAGASTPSAHVRSVGVSPGTATPTTGTLEFGNPTDIALEYNAAETTLTRIYVAERGRNEIVAINAETGATQWYDLKRLNASTVTTGAVGAANMNLPTGLLFEKTSTGGVLYANSAATDIQANILAMAIDSGTVPATSAVALAINPVPATSSSSPINISGTTAPAATTVSCSVNSGTFSSATGTSSWTLNGISLVAGNNYILCKAVDGTGLTTFAEAYTYNTGGDLGTAPALAIVSPDPLVTNYTKNSTVLVSGTSNSVGVTIAIPGSTCSPTDANNNWSCLVTLVEGSNDINVTASKPGTLPNIKAVTVIKDTTAPTMVISALSDNAVTTDAVQNIDGIVTDVNFGTVNTVEVNGVVVPASAMVTMGANTTYFSAPVTLIRGINQIQIKATDLAGNTTTLTRTDVTLNPEIPGLTVALPADNSCLTSAGPVPANGTAGTGFTTVNAYPVSGGTWSGTLSALSGFREYQFVASGGDNTEVSAKRTINAAAADQLAITSPAADMATKNSSVLIEGNVAAESPAPTISINGGVAAAVETYTSGTGAYSHTLDLLALGEGAHVVKVIANAATTAVRNIIYDATLPELSIQGNANAAPSAITGSIEPSAKISAINIDGSPVSIPLSVVTFSAPDPVTGAVVWTANLTAYPYDSISFTTADPALNEKTLAYKAVMPTGDIDNDGTVRLSDALACLRDVAGTENLVGDAKDRADVGSLVAGHAARDGVVDITDAVLILGKAYGLVSF